MAKYNKKIAEKICELLATGKHSVFDCLDMVGVAHSTYYHWKQTKLDFLDMVEAAEAKRYLFIAERALSGLAKLVDVYEYEEVKTEYAPAKEVVVGMPAQPIVVGMTRTKKKMMPNQAMIQYTLNNLNKERFKTRNQTDHTNNGEAFSFGNFLMGASIAEPAETPDDDFSDDTQDDDNNENI